MAVDPTLAASLDGQLAADLLDDGRLGYPRRYLRGAHDKPYQPKQARAEFTRLADQSVTNITPLVSDTYVAGLFVEGYRAAKAADDSTPWSYWQANGLDARQSIAHRGALEYGTSYALVLPGTVGEKRVPFFRPLSPLRSAAWYQDEDDEFPELALRRKGTAVDGAQLIEVFDRDSVYTFAKPKAEDGATSEWILSRSDAHGLGVTPFVRFRDRLDSESVGIIRPIITLQDRVNEIVFSTLIAIQYASFRQRWATGLAIPEDEDGNPVEPFQSAVDRLWVSEDATARFGDFAQTEMTGHNEVYKLTLKTLAAAAQVSPNILNGEPINVDADVYSQIQRGTSLKTNGYKVLFGESWESGFRLAARAAGDATAAADTLSQVRWKDTEPQSLSQTVDALGKMTTLLGIPAEALWEKVPNTSDQDLVRWKTIRAANPDPLTQLTSEIQRQAGAPEVTPEPPTAAE